jgi:hypothetical protein
MTKEIALGSRVRVTPDDYFGIRKAHEGTVVAQSVYDGRNMLIDFGPKFAGHDGNGVPLSRGEAAKNRNQWFVPAEHLEVLSLAEAPAAKAPQAKQQTDRILAHLLAGKSITQLEAFGVYRIFRLAARIHELKQKGHKIVTNMRVDETGKPFAEYSLVTARRA